MNRSGYQRRLLDALNGLDGDADRLAAVTVAHAPTCQLADSRRCTCSPDFVVRLASGRCWTVDARGKAREMPALAGGRGDAP